MEEKKERVDIFIDGSNFYHSTKNIEAKGYKIDLKRIIDELARARKVETFYYTALLDPEYNLEKYKEHKEVIEDLKKIPNFKVILCDMRKINIGKKYQYEVKGDDVYLAHDLLIGAFDDLYDVAIIASGDADFIPVINTLRKRFKKRVGNAYFRRTSSFKLRQACNFSVNMNMVVGKLLEKDNNKRPASPKR
ncbi:MAG: NYN domain-containing protein [Nanoarchaeota archaeon]|mgnify:FL=1